MAFSVTVALNIPHSVRDGERKNLIFTGFFGVLGQNGTFSGTLMQSSHKGF